MAIELVLSFFTTVAFGIVFNVPARTLVGCGLIGMFSWFMYGWITMMGISPLIATWIASFSVATVSGWLARIAKVPVTIFSIAGIIPIVPGSTAYSTMLSLVEGNTANGLTLGTKTLLSAGAIAGGLVVSVAFSRIWKGFVNSAVYKAQRKQ